MSETLELRPEVAAFAQAMERKLRENDHKGGWKDEDVWALFTRLRKDETAELVSAVYSYQHDGSPGCVLDEAADVANFCLMIADVCGALEPTG